jgi:hypothetical protein
VLAMAIYGAALNGLFTQIEYTTARVQAVSEVGHEAGSADAESIGKLRERLEQLTVDIGFANQVQDVIKKAITQLQV